MRVIDDKLKTSKFIQHEDFLNSSRTAVDFCFSSSSVSCTSSLRKVYIVNGSKIFDFTASQRHSSDSSLLSILSINDEDVSAKVHE